MIGELAVPSAVLVITPSADAAAWSLAVRIESRLIALAPTLAGADTHRGLVQSVQLGQERLRIAHLLHQLLQRLGRDT